MQELACTLCASLVTRRRARGGVRSKRADMVLRQIQVFESIVFDVFSFSG